MNVGARLRFKAHDMVAPLWFDERCPRGSSAGEAVMILQMLTPMGNNDVPKMMRGASRGFMHFLKSEFTVLMPS